MACYLSSVPNQWDCHDPQCDDSTWDHDCPTGPCDGSCWPDAEVTL